MKQDISSDSVQTKISNVLERKNFISYLKCEKKNYLPHLICFLRHQDVMAYIIHHLVKWNNSTFVKDARTETYEKVRIPCNFLIINVKRNFLFVLSSQSDLHPSFGQDWFRLRLLIADLVTMDCMKYWPAGGATEPETFSGTLSWILETKTRHYNTSESCIYI